MNQTQLSIATAQLVAAVGGARAAGQIASLNPSKIYAACDVKDAYSLTAIRIARLEAEAGEPILTGAMMRARLHARPGSAAVPVDFDGLNMRAVNEVVAVSQLARDVHLATEDGRLSPRERHDLCARIADIQRSLSQASADLTDMGARGACASPAGVVRQGGTGDGAPREVGGVPLTPRPSTPRR